MPTANQVATELRKLADSLDAQPETQIISPYIGFYGSDKDLFLATARLLPRPITKRISDPNSSYPTLNLESKSDAVTIVCSAPQSLTCQLVEPAKPAKYRCDPILSSEEEDSIEADVDDIPF